MHSKRIAAQWLFRILICFWYMKYCAKSAAPRIRILRARGVGPVFLYQLTHCVVTRLFRLYHKPDCRALLAVDINVGKRRDTY